MKAWQRQREIIDNEEPRFNPDDNEIFWEEANSIPEVAQDNLSRLYWHSNVPGSRASESICIAAVQATENKGMIVENNEELLDEGLKAYEENDIIKLHKLTYKVFEACYNAKKDEESPYWNQKFYHTFEEYEKAVIFPNKVDLIYDEKMVDKQHAAWLSRIIGGAYGTCIEGYMARNILKKYGGVVDYYVRKPNTFNDDITYELALLLAYERCKKDTTAKDISEEWISRIPSGWSAEDFALRNLKAGIVPPMSGRFNNPFNEWIGAQMRGAICGQIYPGNVKMAAKAAFEDATISHVDNGVLGEVFNAIVVSMAFYEKDVKKIVKDAIDLIPEDSEYGKVIRFAYDKCQKYDDYYDAWLKCEEEYKKYNWIHTYPNACTQIIGLWYGQGEFTKTLATIGGCGQDVDCNAAQMMVVIGVINGLDSIPEYWSKPFDDNLDTVVRGIKKLSIKDLANRTTKLAEELNN